MHEAGVRGARLNRVSPVGETQDAALRFDLLAPMLIERGWHLEWFARAEQLPAIAARHAGNGPVCVLDHLAGLHAAIGDDDPAWRALGSLADAGAWLKLSGWYRLGSSEPYGNLVPVIRGVAAIFGDHMVWGSDWPHTQFSSDRLPAYRSTWAPVEAALGPAAAADLLFRHAAIYR